MLTMLVKLLKALNSEQSTSQLSAAVSFSLILGLTPLLSLHNAFILLLIMWFRVNLTLLIISYPLFALLGFLFSSVFESIGLVILQAPFLTSLWEAFFNTLVGRWSNFYYAGVMGSFVVSVILALVLFPIISKGISIYRERWLTKINQLKIMKFLKTTKFWHLYSEKLNLS